MRVMGVKKERLDVLLVHHGYYTSRQQAQRAIMAGLIRVNQERADKAGMKVPEDARIDIVGRVHPYVSRGGLKLEKAIKAFSLDLSERIVLDIGSSTGGFTDCALQHGAKKVYAVDVGYGQLAWKLRQDHRVEVMERTNFRYIKPDDLPGELPDFACIDVSFISLSHILPPLKEMLTGPAEVVALVKPQFEAGREQVGKKGVVRDPAVHQDVLRHFGRMAQTKGFRIRGFSPSPIKGSEGNIEFVTLLDLTGTPMAESDLEEAVRRVVTKAHHSVGEEI